MVEVFKTNVRRAGQAKMILDEIHKSFTDYTANFDLKDCDRILRVKCVAGAIRSSLLIDLVKAFGCYAEVLPDSALQPAFTRA